MAAFTGIFLFKKYKRNAVKFFLFFLIYLTICDFLGAYTHFVDDNGIFSFLKGTRIQYNYWLSTLTWSIGSVVFFIFYYHKILNTRFFKCILKFCGYVFLTISLVQIITEWDAFFVRYFPLISVLGAVFIIMCTVFYFIEILKSEKILDFYKSIDFYISIAIFIWWLIITPLVFYDIYNSKSDWDFVILKWQIYLFANIFMYTTFTIGLIVSKPEQSNTKPQN